MINKKKIITETNESMECDICHKKYNCVGNEFEIQEFLNINFIGGYKSIFGDMNKVEYDICQYCLKELLFPACSPSLPEHGCLYGLNRSMCRWGMRRMISSKGWKPANYALITRTQPGLFRVCKLQRVSLL